MNPVLAAALAQLEQKAMTAAIGAVSLLAKDLAAGKALVDALNDLAMTTAEQQALLLDEALTALGE